MISKEKISKSVTLLSSKDPELKVFDIIMETKFGSTYNSYLIDGGEEFALVDTAKKEYFKEYIKQLKQITNLKKIKYLIINHTEPDHSGEIEKILELLPEITIIGTLSAITFLKDICNKSFKFIEVKENFSINIGNKKIEFIIAPNLHWPDSMFTYLESEKILFTCDVFGAHYCSNYTYVDQIPKNESENYQSAKKYYYDCIFSPFKKFVIQGLKKIENLEIEIIGPSHGPIFREKIKKLISEYKKFSKSEEIQKNKIIIIYTSAYGYTQNMAEEIKKGIKKEKINVELIDLVYTPLEIAINKINTSSGFLIGSPTINSDTVPQIWNLLTNLSPLEVKDKFCAVFGSYGWSGEAIRNIESRLSQLKCEIYRPGLRIKFNPNEKTKLLKCKNFGIEFGKKFKFLEKNKQISETKNQFTWECMNCGEKNNQVELPKLCNVCGAENNQFISIQKEEINKKSNKKEKIVIIGSNISILSAITAIKERNKIAEIILLSKENYLPDKTDSFFQENINENKNNLPGKSNINSKNNLIKPQTLSKKNSNWFKKNNIEYFLSCKKININQEKQEIIFTDKENQSRKIKFNKLLIAENSKPKKIDTHILSYQENETSGIYYLNNDNNTKKNYKEILKYIKKNKINNISILGASSIGIKIAGILSKLEKNINIIELNEQVLSEKLDKEASEILVKHLKNYNINILFNQTIKNIFFNKQNKIEKIELFNQNKIINCELLIISICSISNLEIIQDTKIKTNIELNKNNNTNSNNNNNNKILIDKNMQTNISSIYSSGPCCEYLGKTAISQRTLKKMGYIAGCNITGDLKEYIIEEESFYFNDLNIEIFSIGDLGLKKEKNEYQILELKDLKLETYRKFYFLDNQFVGGVLIGNLQKSSQLKKALDKKSTMQHFLDMHFLDE